MPVQQPPPIDADFYHLDGLLTDEQRALQRKVRGFNLLGSEDVTVIWARDPGDTHYRISAFV